MITDSPKLEDGLRVNNIIDLEIKLFIVVFFFKKPKYLTSMTDLVVKYLIIF